MPRPSRKLSKRVKRTYKRKTRQSGAVDGRLSHQERRIIARRVWALETMLAHYLAAKQELRLLRQSLRRIRR